MRMSQDFIEPGWLRDRGVILCHSLDIRQPRLETMFQMSLAGFYLTSLLCDMLAKVTSKNQLTLPKQVVDALGNPSHFEVEVDGDRLVLTPSRPGSANAVRRKLHALGLLESDVMDAVAWARTNE